MLFNVLIINEIKFVVRSFGCILYELNKLEKAFDGSMYEIYSGISQNPVPQLDSFFGTILEKYMFLFEYTLYK